MVIRQASVALKNTYLVAELQQRILECERLHRQVLYASEEERKRIARELHDQIIQELIGLNYQLSELRVELALGLDSRLARLQEEVRHLLSDVRGICADLRPPVLDSLGLVSAVRSRIHEVESQKALRIRLVVEGNEEQDLTEEIALCVYRVLQESLLNVQKHAAAQRVDVTLQISSAEVALLVVDDGNGFNMPQRLGLLTSDGHFGLVGLRERLDLVRGTLEIISAPGKGTRLEAHVPLADSYDLRC